MKRSRAAHLLAFVALAAACIGALGPAERVSTTYSWPPETLPDLNPRSTWYTPLLLIRRQPEELDVRVPCVLPPALPDASPPLTVVATARSPEGIRGLWVTHEKDRLVVRVGQRVLARPTLAGPGELNGTCEHRLRLADGRWSLDGGPAREAQGGELDFMPVVNGIFSSLDLRVGTPPSVDVTTSPHAATTSTLQAISWVLAVVCALSALVVAAFRRRPHAHEAVSAVRAAIASARPVDAVVGAALLVWWVVAPAGFDDGWVVARQGMYSSAGGFTNYYDSLGANHPLGYWLEWVQHWLTSETASLILLRLPVLVCLALTWVLCRWALSRALSSAAPDGRVLWALASAFLVGAFAGGMTLRPEPEIALLAMGVLLCALYFLERETAAPIAVAAVLVALALAAHPAGVVTAAPLIVVLPALLRWARSNIALAASLVTAGGALLIVVTFVGSDLEQRRLDSQTIRTYGNANASWRDEITRYSGLFLEQYGSPLRRAAVALLGLAVIAYVLRSRRGRQPLLDLPAAGIAVALLLLTLTPSKWPWHFAALLGVAAVAVATETARLREDARLSSGWSPRPFLVVGVGILAIAWSWSPRHIWNHLDLQTLTWTLGFERSTVALSSLAVAAPVVLLLGIGILERLRRSGHSLADVPWRVACWTAAVLAAPLLAFTTAVLVADAVRTESWTLTRQNLAALGGDPDCGLAEGASVPISASMEPLRPTSDDRVLLSTGEWVPPAPVEGLVPLVLGPVTPGSVARSPWFEATGTRDLGVFVAGHVDFSSLLVLEWGVRRRGETEVLTRNSIRALLAPELQSEHLYWRFFAGVDLPKRPPEANRVRLALYTSVPSGISVAVGAVAYADERLVERFRREGSKSLVAPNLLMYLPCANLPLVRDGTFEVPDSIVALRDWEHPIFGRTTTPFAGIFDLYRLYRLPLTYSDRPPKSVVVYEFDRRIPGSAQAPPTKRSFTT